MNNTTNVFKEQNEIWDITKRILVSIMLGIIITFGVSLVCGFRYDIVVTYSMYPTLTRGSMVVIEPTSYEDLKIGDIVNFKFGNTTCTHRLVDFAEGGELITQGDASTSREKISKEKYLGKVVYHENVVGNLIMLIRENTILAVLAAAIILFVYVIVW